MTKNDKKTDKAIIAVLTDVCHIAQEKYNGFEWLTHFANYNNFPSSLSVVCVYNTNQQLKNTDKDELCELINDKLLTIDINIKDIRRQVSFDTEENCNNEHNGNWNERFK